MFNGVVVDQSGSGLNHIYLANSDGSSVRPITASPHDLDAIWSPDGSMIASVAADNIVESVVVMQADGTGARTVFRGMASAISWSPDGHQLALSGTQYPPLVSRFDYQIYVVPLDGSEPRNISQSNTIDSTPAWSPDGKQVAFIRSVPNTLNSGIYLMNADGSNQRQLTSPNIRVFGDEVNWSPWSPDGHTLLFEEVPFIDVTPEANMAPGVPGIDVIDVDGTNLRRFSGNSQEDVFPRWSPDGRQILFTRGLNPPRVGSVPTICVMQADGSNVRCLTDGATPSDSGVWSPDGSGIAYFGAAEPFDPSWVIGDTYQVPVTNLVVMDADGNNAHIVVPNVRASGIMWKPTTD